MTVSTNFTETSKQTLTPADQPLQKIKIQYVCCLAGLCEWSDNIPKSHRLCQAQMDRRLENGKAEKGKKK